MVWVRVHSDDLSSQLRRWWSRGWKAAGHDEGDEPCLKWSLERERASHPEWGWAVGQHEGKSRVWGHERAAA